MLGLLGGVVLLAGARSAGANSNYMPVVTTQPDIGIVAAPGDSFDFTADAGGTPAPSVQWQWAPGRDGPWTNLPDETDATLHVISTQDASSPFALGHAFRAVFTNSEGSTASRPAKIVSKTSWMHDLGDTIADIPLNELALPGSHDMGTYGINGSSAESTDGQSILCDDLDLAHDLCESFSTAQSSTEDATKELNGGIRYFDLRICSHGDTFVTCHGLEAAPLADILAQTRAWVDAHPTEVVFLDFNHHYIPTDANAPESGLAKLDAEANAIEQAFALIGGGSLLVKPQYCTPGDPTSGTCAANLTLRQIAADAPRRVIVNFENDGAPGDCIVSGQSCFYRQPSFGTEFYDRHPDFWGRSADPPTETTGGDQGFCTHAAAVTSCYANEPLSGPAYDRVSTTLGDRASFTDPGTKNFFLQFLQTTPDGGYIVLNPTSSLLDMAKDSNPFIGNLVFGSAPFMPENYNVLALNFFDYTQYSAAHFDFVHDVIDLDEYGRTPPVIRISSLIEPAANGWYNAAALASHQDKLQVDLEARDYKYVTGIHAFTCDDSATTTHVNLGGVSPPLNAVIGTDYLTDGVHAISCSAEDGATKGFHHQGNVGAGPGSTSAATFKVDTTPPVLNPAISPNPPMLHGSATADPGATDATSGVASVSCDPVDTTTAGDHVLTCTALDNAGNPADAELHYLVAYDLHGLLAPAETSKWKAGTTVPIKVALSDADGNPIPDAEAQSLVDPTCRITFTVSGAQTLNDCMRYDSKHDQFVYNWKIARDGAGSATVEVTVSYPGTTLTTSTSSDITVTS